MQTLKARGQRGSWFARVGDDDIPCAWLQWRTGNHYLDPLAKTEGGKWPKYIEALRRDLKVVLTDKREDDDGNWHRDGYKDAGSVKHRTGSRTRAAIGLI
jgi:hypothetical protein